MRSLPIRILFPALMVLSAISALGVDADQSEYIPVKPGSEWTMDVVLTGPTGKVNKAVGRRRIEDVVEKDGRKYVRSRTWMEGGPSPMEYTKLIRKDADGLHTIAEDGKNGKEQTEIPLPMKPGATWKCDARGVTLNETVIGIESVKIGDKTYENCFHIRIESADGMYREDFWEAPKVGGVKSEIAYGSGGKIALTLREFKTGK
jgi:hypothetical protein